MARRPGTARSDLRATACRLRRDFAASPADGGRICSLGNDFNALGVKICNFRALTTRPFGPNAPPRRDARFCRSPASGAIPSPGAESIFSSPCSGICGPTPFCRQACASRDLADTNGEAQMVCDQLSRPDFLPTHGTSHSRRRISTGDAGLNGFGGTRQPAFPLMSARAEQI